MDLSPVKLRCKEQQNIIAGMGKMMLAVDRGDTLPQGDNVDGDIYTDAESFS